MLDQESQGPMSRPALPWGLWDLGKVTKPLWATSPPGVGEGIGLAWCFSDCPLPEAQARRQDSGGRGGLPAPPQAGISSATWQGTVGTLAKKIMKGSSLSSAHYPRRPLQFWDAVSWGTKGEATVPGKDENKPRLVTIFRELSRTSLWAQNTTGLHRNGACDPPHPIKAFLNMC